MTSSGASPARPPQAGQQTSGDALVLAVQDGWRTDDPVALIYLRTAGASQDRRVGLSALLDGPDGLLVKLAAGQAPVSAKAVEVLLKAERQAADDLWDAIDRLHLEDSKPEPSRHQEAS